MHEFQEQEIASIFNHMFTRYAEPGFEQLENLQEDIGDLSSQLELNDDLHATLTHIALAAGSTTPAYSAVSRAFNEMADMVVTQAERTTGLYRQVLQHDACVLLTFAEIAAPRQRDGNVVQGYAEPIISTALRLLDTKPDPAVEEMLNDSTALMHARTHMPKGIRNPAVPGAPHLDALTQAAQRILHRHMN